MRGKNGVDLPTLDPVAISGWMVSATPRPLYHRERDPIPIVKEAGWAWGRSGRMRKISSPCRFETLHHSFFQTRNNFIVTWMKAQGSGGGRRTTLGKVQTATVTDVRKLVSAPLSPSFKCYLDPEFPHNHDWKDKLIKEEQYIYNSEWDL